MLLFHIVTDLAGGIVLLDLYSPCVSLTTSVPRPHSDAYWLNLVAFVFKELVVHSRRDSERPCGNHLFDAGESDHCSVSWFSYTELYHADTA